MNLGTEERMGEKLNKKDLTTFTFTPMLDRPTDRPTDHFVCLSLARSLSGSA